MLHFKSYLNCIFAYNLDILAPSLFYWLLAPLKSYLGYIVTDIINVLLELMKVGIRLKYNQKYFYVSSVSYSAENVIFGTS